MKIDFKKGDIVRCIGNKSNESLFGDFGQLARVVHDYFNDDYDVKSFEETLIVTFLAPNKAQSAHIAQKTYGFGVWPQNFEKI